MHIKDFSRLEEAVTSKRICGQDPQIGGIDSGPKEDQPNARGHLSAPQRCMLEQRKTSLPALERTGNARVFAFYFTDSCFFLPLLPGRDLINFEG